MKRSRPSPAARRPYKKPRQATPQSSMVMYRSPGGITKLGEVKSVDIAQAPITLNGAGAVAPLNLIQAGSSFFNRIGRKINMKSIKLTGYIAPIRAQTNVDYVRVMVVYDRQTNGALPTLSDILQTTTQTGANTTDVLSSPNLNNRDRFTIIRDNKYVLPHVTGAAAPFTTLGLVDQMSHTNRYDVYAKLKGMVTQFRADSSPAVIGDVATGGLFVVTIGDFAAGTEGYHLQLETRLRYYDS